MLQLAEIDEFLLTNDIFRMHKTSLQDIWDFSIICEALSFGCCATISGHPTYPHFRRLYCHNVWSLQRRLCGVSVLLFGSCSVTWTSKPRTKVKIHCFLIVNLNKLEKTLSKTLVYVCTSPLKSLLSRLRVSLLTSRPLPCRLLTSPSSSSARHLASSLVL